MLNQQVEPLPGVDSTPISLSNFSMIVEQMEDPSPVP